MSKKIIILGAGLSGLRTAGLLKMAGYKILVIEARERLGGRIFTKSSAGDTPVEMGATWFGAKHTHLTALLKELGVEYYEQHTQGIAFFEPFSLAPPQRIEVPEQLPSYRISGGSMAVINKLAEGLDTKEIVFGNKIESLQFDKDKVTVLGKSEKWEAAAIISTLPPALLFMSINMEPGVALEVKNIGLNTHTWMQDSIKTAIVYKEPFWRTSDLSDTLFSNVGPVTDLYDHSDHKVEKYALCGFVNGGYAAISADERMKKVMQQLEKFFGPVVLQFLEYEECIWNDDYIKHPDMQDIFPHQNNGHPIFEKPLYDGKFFLSGAETARNFPGYMDGAVQSAERVVQDILKYIPLQ